GWLGSFTRYRGRGGGTDLPNWLEMHRAGTITVDRSTTEEKLVYVPHAAVSVCGGIQPAVLASRMTREFMGSGLIARFVMAMPPRQPKEWTDAEIAPETRTAVERNLDHLLALGFGTNMDGDPVPVVLRMRPEARAEWVAFYNQWARRQCDAEGEMAA